MSRMGYLCIPNDASGLLFVRNQCVICSGFSIVSILGGGKGTQEEQPIINRIDCFLGELFDPFKLMLKSEIPHSNLLGSSLADSGVRLDATYIPKQQKSFATVP